MFLLQIMTRASFGTMYEGTRVLDDEERMAQWTNNLFPEFHNDDALWGYTIRAETLGTGAQIPTGYMVKTLRAQSTYDSNVLSD